MSMVAKCQIIANTGKLHNLFNWLATHAEFVDKSGFIKPGVHTLPTGQGTPGLKPDHYYW